MSTRDERAEATRDTLIRVARELFGAHGYAQVGTELIVERAGVTRGSLYHHFDGKHELLRAVYEQVEAEVVADLAGRVGTTPTGDLLDALYTGLRAFLDTCTDREFIQIAMLDAPTVLGWAAWREIAERYGLGLITAALAATMDAGLVRRQPVRPLALVLGGAIDEAAMYIADAADPATARDEMETVLISLLEGLRVR
jgi:AcrR family transcriptional regulator